MRDSAPPPDTGTDRAPELAHTLVAGQFFLVYQPMFDLNGGTISGEDSLMRWRHPQRGVLAPADVIGDLETSKVIAAVERWTLATESHTRGYCLAVSVNISSRQLNAAEFIDGVTIAVTASHLPPRALIL